LIEDGVVVISNAKPVSVYKSSPPRGKTGFPEKGNRRSRSRQVAEEPAIRLSGCFSLSVSALASWHQQKSDEVRVEQDVRS
jgi:hypothetical protein